MEPPKKKQRLAREQKPKPAILTREMESLETSLEVDHMILDYLLHHAIDTCLQRRHQHTDNEQVEKALLQVDEFLALFKRRYGNYNFDAEMRFRQQLLQLVTLLTQRFTQNSTTPSSHTLEALRERNKSRARQWIGEASRLPSTHLDTKAYDAEFPLPLEDLERNRARVLEELDIPAENDLYDDAFYGTKASVSLLDLLPMLMSVSAQCTALYNSKMKDQLMQLAATWMLHACLEQYLVYGASGTDAIDEAFAWGYKRGEQDDQTPPQRQQQQGRAANAPGETTQSRTTDSATRLVINMFEGENGTEVDEWGEIRDATMEELKPFASDLPSHYARKAVAHSHARAEEGFIQYLKALAQCIPTPVLAQLESGQLDGMTEEETQNFIEYCGLEIIDFFT